MGSSQSSQRAAKFNGTRSSVRLHTAPSTVTTMRRAQSVRNTNRSVKEFSKFWSDAAERARCGRSTAPSACHTPQQTPRGCEAKAFCTYRNSRDTSPRNSPRTSQRRPQEKSPTNYVSEIYCDEFNHAAIAAARLRRLSLTPYTPEASPKVSPKVRYSPETTIY